MEEFIDFKEELNNPGYVFPVIETRAFVDHLLPPLRKGVNVKNVKSTLKKRGYIDASGKWKDLWTVSGGKRRKKHDAFAPLVDIFEKATSVASARLPHLEQILEMVLLPEKGEGRRRSTFSQNACFVLKDREEQSAAAGIEECAISSWCHIALTASFRRTSSEESRKKNARRVISDIQLAMVRDPSRRFSFGITVENANIRLWFCSRASPVVSKPFNFSRDLDLLIHVFLSLAFASKEELGWDPTFRPFVKNNGKLVHHIDIDGETYETCQTLSKSSADELISHATRVWIVNRVGSDVPYVLKDVWTEDDQMPEHSVREALLLDIEEKYGAETREEVATHLLTPIAHCIVRVNSEEDHTGNVMMRGYTPTFKEKYRVNVENLGKCDDDDMNPSTEIGIEGLGRGDLKDPLNWYNPMRRILHRKHYRIVFKEVGKSLRTTQNMSDVFTVLSDSAKVLKFIHGAGWVHRDLSIGNLYIYKSRGLIGDLEYAKRKNSDIERELLTGTPHFMAVEAAERRYAHLPPIKEADVHAQLKALKENRREDLEKLVNERRPPSFFHNDLHDLESLWWIAIWELFHRPSSFEGGVTGNYDEEQDEQRRLAGYELFPRSSETTSRRLFLQVNFHYYNSLRWLPDRLGNMKSILDIMRTTIVHKYVQFEATFPNVRMDVFDGSHDKFHELFGTCKEFLGSAKTSCRKVVLPRKPVNMVSSNLPTRRSGRRSEHGRAHAIPCVTTSEMKSTDLECAPRVLKRKRDSSDETLVTERPLKWQGKNITQIYFSIRCSVLAK